MTEEATIELVAGIDAMGRDTAAMIVAELGSMPHGDGMIGTGDARYTYCVRARKRAQELQAN